MNKHLTLDGINIDYSVTRSKRKTIGLKISMEKGLQISAPRWATEESIQTVIKEKSSWIIKKLIMVNTMKSQCTDRTYRDGELFFYKGMEYSLRIIYRNDIKKALAEFINGFLKLTIPTTINPENYLNTLKQCISLHYRESALMYLNERIILFSGLMQVFPLKVSVKEQKTRWGSCTSDNKINLNWKLIMSPPKVADYVIVHELSHIKIKNHSQAFWKVVESILPDYKLQRNWLKSNGYKLYI